MNITFKTEKQVKEALKSIRDGYLTYRNDFYSFCLNILGYRDMNDEHKKLCEFMQEDTKKFRLVLMPRYTFKSCICTIGYSLWRLLKNPNERILIYSDASTKAQGFLTGIRNHILSKSERSIFRNTFGAWETDPKSGKWNENQIIVSIRYAAQSECSIETAGIDTSMVGKHFDAIIFDDVVSDKNITTKDQMDKTVECYSKALSLLRPGGTVIMLGTRWNFGDLYGKIIAENKQKDTFKIFIRDSGYNAGKLLFDNIGKNSLTWEFLKLQRTEQGSYIFSCLYENNPTDPETAVFKVADFNFYGSIKPDDLYITATCDPAGEGRDFTAITVAGTDNKMKLYILDIVNKHLQPSEIINEIIRLNYRYRFRLFGLERNFFRGMLKKELDRRITEERVNPDFKLFGIREFRPSSRAGENKNQRIMALQPYHERGDLLFPGNNVELLEGAFSTLAFQMIQFPNSAFDDILDSLAYHLPLTSRGGIVKNSEPPKYSAAWLEKRAYDDEIARVRRLPRRYRHAVAGLSFS